MARIPKRLFGPAQLTNAAATKYTVPAATKTILRHIHIENPGAAVTLTMSIGADAAGTRIFDAYPIGATTVFDHFCYYVMDIAEVLQAFASVTTQLVLTVDGDEIILG